MKKIITRIGAAGAGLTIAASSLAGISASALTQSTSSANNPSTFIAPLHPLNHSGVTGFARLSINDTQPGANLNATISARGLEPNQVHPMHIHGMLDGSDAECPTNTADTNKDRLVSVFEGAPFYGPIKVSFTDPATMFGPPSRTDLFAPFAGVPIVNNFPHSDNSGKFQYNQNIPFDTNNQYAVQALASLTPLNDQHIVLHGGYAPESVDTPGGSPTKIVYDALLPVACGPIMQTHQGSSDSGNSNNDSDSGQTGNSGPGSTTTETSTTNITVTNNNHVTSTNKNSQTARSGRVNNHDNTFSSDASSGSAMNDNDSMTSVDIKNN